MTAANRVEDRFVGSLLGLALGDALGAPYEGGPIERLLWLPIGRTRRGARRWTDDTQMALDVAESLVACGGLDQDDLARRFAASYRWDRGYGAGAAKLLKRIRGGADWREANRSVFPDGSYGNGASMRAPVVGLFYARRPDALTEAARASAEVTHTHPLGMEGALLIARATALALLGRDPVGLMSELVDGATESWLPRLGLARRWLDSADDPPAHRVAKELGNGIAAIDSCTTAVYVALRFLGSPFTEMVRFTVACGGDADTIGAMAGAIWGAANGAEPLPVDELASLEARQRVEAVARDLHRASDAAAG